MLDDQALLLHYARSRDAGSFAQLVGRYSALVFSIACRVTGNTATAEDVTQDCFLKLARQADSIRGSLPGWLHRVALNRSLQVIRNEATRKRHESRVSPTSEPDNEPGWNQIAPHVDSALSRLPQDVCEPLVQHFLLGRTQNQIAEILGVNQATVSRRIQEGIEMIRSHLKKSGVVCGSVALSSALVKNATAAVPARLSTALAKMAIAGPAAITTAQSSAAAGTAAILAANAKLIAIIASVVVVAGLLTYHFVLAPAKSHPRSYLSDLRLQGDGLTQDSFSLAFQATAKLLNSDADYETIYALSANIFCPAIDLTRQNKSRWPKQGCLQAFLDERAIDTLCARYGFVVRNLEQQDFIIDFAKYRRTMAPIVLQSMDSGNVVLVDSGLDDGIMRWPSAGIITNVRSDGAIYGAALNGRRDNPIIWPRGIWAITPGAVTLSPHEADIATLRSAVARIRSQPPYQTTPKSVYGLTAMDAWIMAMSETPGFCIACNERFKRNPKERWNCARVNAQNMQTASKVAARYLRRIASDFPPDLKSRLESAAAHYDRIAELIDPALANNGPNSYINILGDLSKQRAHALKILTPIRSEYSAIAHDLDLALTDVKP